MGAFQTGTVSSLGPRAKGEEGGGGGRPLIQIQVGDKMLSSIGYITATQYASGQDSAERVR